jgi:hypothetical protein
MTPAVLMKPLMASITNVMLSLNNAGRLKVTIWPGSVTAGVGVMPVAAPMTATSATVLAVLLPEEIASIEADAHSIAHTLEAHNGETSRNVIVIFLSFT